MIKRGEYQNQKEAYEPFGKENEDVNGNRKLLGKYRVMRKSLKENRLLEEF